MEEMTEEMSTEISKKELLEVTGISYGQLYRWKRERLIPEDWFVKRSAFTGQETYFPREAALERVHAILQLKDDYSLPEIRDILASEVDLCLTREELSALDDLRTALLDAVEVAAVAVNVGSFRLVEAAWLVMLSGCGDALKLDDETLVALANAGLPMLRKLPASNIRCLLIAVKGSECVHYTSVFLRSGQEPVFDASVTVVKSALLNDLVSGIGVIRERLGGALKGTAFESGAEDASKGEKNHD